ncbi:hypothetical protein ACP4OV_024657 [Aristida adscensionis]
MRWGLKSKQQPREAQQPRGQEQPESKQGKQQGKAAFSSFSPLAWLSKITARSSAAAAKPGHATAPPAPPAQRSAAQPTAASPSCFHRRASPSPASGSSPADSSPPGAAAADAARRRGSIASAAADIVPPRCTVSNDVTESTAAADIAPRRRSVGNDDTESAAAAARQLYRRRHYSVGGDRDLPALGHLISLSRSASPQPAPARAPARTLAPLAPLPSDMDEEKRPRSRRCRHRRVTGRRSFSSGTKAPGARVASTVVRVRSPRLGAAAAAVSELERFAVVRRTRDPQREFRASMVEMIASKRMVGRPEELETLLACYLSLNADEHHDCIVKVFRQVWFELNNPARRGGRSAAAAQLS